MEHSRFGCESCGPWMIQQYDGIFLVKSTDQPINHEFLYLYHFLMTPKSTLCWQGERMCSDKVEFELLKMTVSILALSQGLVMIHLVLEFLVSVIKCTECFIILSGS